MAEAARASAGRGVTARDRRPSLRARGEPMLWVTGACLALSVVMIVGLVGLIAFRGMSTFWPRAVEEFTLADGRKVLGMVVGREAGPGAGGDEEGAGRVYVRRGNRDLEGSGFVWINEREVTARARPADAVLVERLDWGPFIGRLARVEVRGEAGASGGAAAQVWAGEEAWGALEREMREARARSAEIGAIASGALAASSRARERVRLAERQAEIDAQRTAAGVADDRAPPWAWGAGLAATLGLGVLGWRLGSAWSRADGSVRGTGEALLRLSVWAAVGAGIVFAWVERPGGVARVTAEDLAEVRAAAAREVAALDARDAELLARIAALRAEDARRRVVFVDAGGERFAPVSSSEPGEPMLVSSVVRVVRPNDAGLAEKAGVYLGRWWDFVSRAPTDSNMGGGIFPVLFGTIVLTLLLCVTVVPLGVVGALYLREYAPQGWVTSAVRIAVNNLAGVPSIVYGVFGWGFFLLTVGQWIDAGPGAAAVLPRGAWWLMGAGLGAFVVLALLLGLLVRREARAGRSVDGGSGGKVRWLRWGVGAAWVVCAGLAVALLATTPYFFGFFEAKKPSSTFGGKGILWAALTLALLTLPVVIVSTEEAIAAVPRSMREGAYAAGATKWQTVRSVVLPQALPGIMTGAILAMARGAGEVAPLMLVGAAKVAPRLPVDGEAPFVHLERSFMHLGFHIYDLALQSSEPDAARPLVWTSTLVLIAMVLGLNFAAIVLRARVRARLRGSAV